MKDADSGDHFSGLGKEVLFSRKVSEDGRFHRDARMRSAVYANLFQAVLGGSRKADPKDFRGGVFCSSQSQVYYFKFYQFKWDKQNVICLRVKWLKFIVEA